MRDYDVCVTFDHSLVLKLQLILNRKKNWEMKKILSYTPFKISSFFNDHITSSLVILKIMEIITNFHWRKSWNKWDSEKKALGVTALLGTPGKLIPGLWIIELQTCQSDSINSLWLVRWNLQLSSLAPGQFLPVMRLFLNWKTGSLCLHPVFYLWLKLDRRQVHGLSSRNCQCWKQDMRIKTWLLGKMHLTSGFSSIDWRSYLPLRYGQVSCSLYFFLLVSTWTTLK